jgi:hypothetical protein
MRHPLISLLLAAGLAYVSYYWEPWKYLICATEVMCINEEVPVSLAKTGVILDRPVYKARFLFMPWRGNLHLVVYDPAREQSTNPSVYNRNCDIYFKGIPKEKQTLRLRIEYKKRMGRWYFPVNDMTLEVKCVGYPSGVAFYIEGLEYVEYGDLPIPSALGKSYEQMSLEELRPYRPNRLGHFWLKVSLERSEPAVQQLPAQISIYKPWR